MATSTAQRVGIWVIAVAMTVGTIAGFIAMIIGSQSDQQKQAALSKYQSAYTKFQQESAEQDEDLAARTDTLSKKYASVFVPYKKRVGAFDAESVKELSVKELKGSDYKVITDDTTYAAYYIGFNPKGKIFDSSLDGKKLKTPFIVRPNGVIEGWKEAMKGKKIGGVYELTIPSDKAYGEQGSGDDIEPNMPLKFIVMPIELLKTLDEPELTREVLEAYAG